MKKIDYLNFLKALKAKAQRFMSPASAAAVVLSLDGMIGNVESDGEDDKAKAYQAKVMASLKGDVEARAEVTTIRKLRTQNFLYAMSNWMQFFSVVNLGNTEAPYWENMSQQECKAAYSGIDGRPRMSQILKFREQVQIQMEMLTSEEFEYPLMDLLRGNIADEIKGLIDVARDLAEKISQKAKPFVTGACVSAFTTTGGKETRTFMLHSAIDSSNIPTTNRLAPTSSTFGKAAIDAILQYGAAWGNVFGGQMLRPQFAIVPSKDSRGILGDITLTSQPNSAVEQIINDGYLTDYGGEKWTIIPDATLSASDGFAYVKFREIGEVYFKPGLDQMWDEVTREQQRMNKGSMSMGKPVGFVAPLPWNPFVCRVKYK